MNRVTAILSAALLGLTLPAAPASADDLLLGTGERVDGGEAGAETGVSSAPAGDFNGDGRPDLVIGAPLFDYLGRADSGAVYVVFGSATPSPTVDLNALGSRGFRIGGSAAGDRAGQAVAGGKDVNGDGFDDIVIGAPAADFNLREGSGSVYVVFGGPSPVELDLATLGTRGARIDGAASFDRFGSSVSSPGDVNGDARPDVLAGAPDVGAGRNGAAFVALAPFAGTLDLAAAGASAYRIQGAAGGDRAGTSVAGVGDVNGDGRADVLIGAPDASNNGRSFSGSTYVVYGLAAPATISLASLGGVGYRIDGAASTHNSGRGLGSGDINGDGKTDVLIGAVNADYNGRNDSGSVYAVFGGSPGPVDLANLGAAGIRVDGEAVNQPFGLALTAVDLNGDQVDDLVVASVRSSANGRVDSGSVFVINGGPSIASRDLGVTPADRRFDGAAAGDLAGSSVAAVGDMNGDTGKDLVIGASWAGNNGRAKSGSGYVVFGDPLRTPVVPTPTPDPQATPATPAATLTVVARKARKAVPRTGRAKLVKRVTVGPGQSATITVKVTPRKAKKKVKVATRTNSVSVRTKRAPRARITVRIVSSGTGFIPTSWVRAWKVR